MEEKTYFGKSLKFWGLAVFSLIAVFMYYSFTRSAHSDWLNYAFIAPIAGAVLCAFMEHYTLFLTVIAVEIYMIVNGASAILGLDSWWSFIILIIGGFLALLCIGITIVSNKPSNAKKF